MNTKYCNKCQETKTVDSFYLHKTSPDGRYSLCKTCKGKKRKAWSEQHRDILRDIIRAAKNRPCVDCGHSYPYYVMDFDHIDNNKTMNISLMVGYQRSIESIKDEISKCEVVCANCHRERTYLHKQRTDI